MNEPVTASSADPVHHHWSRPIGPFHTRNVNELHAQGLSAGARVADAVAALIGSWRFIIVQSIILITWIVLNITGFFAHWDPYPFILLNLALSFQAAYSAPIIMMSQNRQVAKDRLQADEDYRVNVRAEAEIAHIHAHVEALVAERWDQLIALQQEQLQLLRTLAARAHDDQSLPPEVEK